MGNVSSIPKEGPLGCTVEKWSDFSCEPMTKRKMNNAWSQSLLGAPHLCRIILGPCIPCTVTLAVLIMFFAVSRVIDLDPTTL